MIKTILGVLLEILGLVGMGTMCVILFCVCIVSSWSDRDGR